MIDRNKELAANTVILGIGQLIPKFLAIVLLPLLTTYLSAEEYGNYDLVLSFASLLIPIVTLQIQQAIFRHLLSVTENEDKTKYVTSAILYILGSSLIYYPIVFIILRFMKLDTLTCIFICLLFWGEAMYTLCGQIVRGLGYNVKYSISVVVYSSVNLLFTAIMLVYLKLGLIGVILSLTFGYISADIYMVISTGLFRYFKPGIFDKQYLRQLLSFSIPIVPSSIALWIVNLSDRLIIIQFLGSAANGIYAVANKIPSLYSTAYNIFNLAWTETASRVSEDGNSSEYYSKLFRGLFDFLIGLMLALIAVTPIIFKILVKGDYGGAINQVPILYFGIFFNSFVNFYSGIYIALKRTKQVGYSSIAGAIFNLLINLFLVKKIGLYAASISTAISFMIIVIYRAYDLNKVIKIDYNFKDILIGVSCFGASSVCLFIGEYPIMIICWGIAIAYNLIYNKKIIVSLVKIFK